MQPQRDVGYWEKRNDAIRRFYGNIAKDQFERLYLCHIWYNPETDKCTAEEPADDNCACISKATQKTAMYGPEPVIYPEK